MMACPDSQFTSFAGDEFAPAISMFSNGQTRLAEQASPDCATCAAPFHPAPLCCLEHGHFGPFMDHTRSGMG